MRDLHVNCSEKSFLMHKPYVLRRILNIYTVNFLQTSRQYRYFTVNGLLKLVRNTLTMI